MTEQQDPNGEPVDDGPRELWIDLPGSSPDRGDVEPVAVGPGGTSQGQHRTQPQRPAQPDPADGDASLLALVDRLAAVLEKSDLGELEVTAGGTTIVLRSAASLERSVAVAAPGDPAVHDLPAPTAPGPAASAQAAAAAAAPIAARPSVKAPLTGIYYGAPSPGATAYVKVGDHVSVGQIIGLIEAMKLFNEIKSDLAGRVVRICAENGALVKAKAPLIEVEPA
jgi:acetyl-CoA carboxylase biotin carboxyl carrier protein